VPETFDARTRAYLLLKQHGQEVCKRTKPRCDQCPISSDCAFFARHRTWGVCTPAGINKSGSRTCKPSSSGLLPANYSRGGTYRANCWPRPT